MADICNTEDTKTQCRSISDYAIACSKLGVIIEEWRDGITECCK